MKLRAVVATALAALCMVVYLLLSGAPARVHVSTSVFVFLGFWLPFVIVGEVELAKKWALAIAGYFLGIAVLYAFTSSVVVAKVEFGVEWWPGVLVVFAGALLAFTVSTVASTEVRRIVSKQRAV